MAAVAVPENEGRGSYRYVWPVIMLSFPSPEMEGRMLCLPVAKGGRELVLVLIPEPEHEEEDNSVL